MEEILLKDICNLDNGYAFRSDDYVESSNTLNCRMSNIRPDGTFDILYSPKYLPDEFAEKYEDYLLNDGDLIIAMTDMAGDPKILGVPTVVDTKGYKLLLNQRVGKLRFIKSGVNADYLKLALQSKKVREYLKRFAGGGVQLNVSKKDILNAPVRIRTEEEQNYIADLFRRVLEIKKQREQELSCLDNLIKARFVELFGDILTDKNLPLVQLNELADIGSSKRIYANEYVEEGVPFYRSKEIRELGSGLKPSVELFIKPERYDEIKAKYGVPKVGDILIAAIGATIGYSWIVNTDSPFYYKDGNLIILSIKKDVNPIFLNHTLGILIEDFKNKGASGSAQLALTIEKLEKMMVVNPDLELQNQFANFVKQVDKSKVVEPKRKLVI